MRALNPIRKAKVKASLLDGRSIRQSLKDAGYSERTAHGNANATDNRLVRTCMEEIAQEFKLSDITAESVLKEIEEARLLALKSGDLATVCRCSELKGKYLALWKEYALHAVVKSVNVMELLPAEAVLELDQARQLLLPSTVGENANSVTDNSSAPLITVGRV
jgi:hypothetical protein